MFGFRAGPTSPAYSCGPGVRTQPNASRRVANRSFSPQAYITGLLVRSGVVNQSSTSDRVPHRFLSTQAYLAGVLVRRGVLTQSSTSSRVPHRFSSTQAYITGLLVRRGVVNQPRASDRVPDCSFSTQAYESRLQSIESRSAFPAPYTALRQLYRPFKVYPSYRHRTPPYLSTAHCFIPRSTRRRTTIGVLYIDPARSEAAAFA